MYGKKKTFLFLFIVLLLGLTLNSAVVSAAAPGEADWYARYWNNRDLTGSPVVTRSERLINYSWGNGAPISGVQADNFSVQWTAYVYFAPGTYRFSTISDDGIRLFVDNRWIINNWTTHTVQTNSATITLAGGTYPILVEYFEQGGGATAKVWWESAAGNTTPTTPPWGEANWYARYWNNSDMEREPVLARSERAINYDWGRGGPGGNVNVDHFSARWTASVTFAAGTYRFTTVSDDAIRVYLGDRHIINNWSAHGTTTDTATVTLNAGTYDIAVDYYERTGGAVARLWWERVDGASVPTTPAGDTAVTNANLRMRSGPGTNYTIMQVVPRNSIVNILGQSADGSWLHCEYRGVSGWMSAAYLTMG